MFFLLPIAHELASVRKWPIFAIVIVVLNVLLLAVTMTVGRSYDADIENAERAAQTYADANPEAAKTARPGCVHGPSPESLDSPEARALMNQLGIPAPEKHHEAETDDAPEVLAKLCTDVEAARDKTIERRFGFVPEKGFGIGIVTHQFLHAGLFHLLFNMWFFWLCGCNLEDRWGKGIFGAFYLAGGAAGAVLFGVMAHDKSIPLIGASGAVAAAMGAFLAILGGTRIRFAYVLWIALRPRYGTFEATAYWMLPLWLASELLQAVAFPNDGTAHWAHVGGFGFGVVVGLVMRFSGIDAKLDAAAEEEGTVHQDARIVDAAALTDQGRFDEAIEALETYLKTSSDDVDALVELLRAVTLTRDVQRRLAVALRLMHSYMGKGFLHAAADVYFSRAPRASTRSRDSTRRRHPPRRRIRAKAALRHRTPHVAGRTRASTRRRNGRRSRRRRSDRAREDGSHRRCTDALPRLQSVAVPLDGARSKSRRAAPRDRDGLPRVSSVTPSPVDRSGQPVDPSGRR